MYATTLSALFSALIDDNEKLGVRAMLQGATNLLSNRGGLSRADYINNARQIRSHARKVLEDNILAYLPDNQLFLLRQGRYSNIMSDRLANLVLSNVSDAPERGGPSGELQFFVQLYDEAMADMRKYVEITKDLPLVEFDVPDGLVPLQITLTEKTFHQDIERMSRAFTDFDRFMSVVTESFHPGEQKPKILYISSGSATVVAVSTLIVAQSVIAMFKGVVEAATLTANFLRAANILKSGGGGSLIDEKQLSDVTERFLDKAMTAQFAAINAEMAKNMSPDTRTRIAMSSSILIERVREGSRITLGNVADRQSVNSDDVSTDDGPSITKLIEQSRTIALKVGQLAAEAEAMPQIEGPTEESPELTFDA